jgi:hypothetical protein
VEFPLCGTPCGGFHRVKDFGPNWRRDVTLQKMIFFAMDRYFLLTECPLMGDPKYYNATLLMETGVMPIIIVKAMWEFKSDPFLRVK